MKKKRYIIFGYADYYPSGGMDDALTSFSSKEELLELVAEDEDIMFDCDFYDVFDTETFWSGSGDTPIKAFKNLESEYNGWKSIKVAD